MAGTLREKSAPHQAGGPHGQRGGILDKKNEKPKFVSRKKSKKPGTRVFLQSGGRSRKPNGVEKATKHLVLEG